jgi:hypothetical protein
MSFTLKFEYWLVEVRELKSSASFKLAGEEVHPSRAVKIHHPVEVKKAALRGLNLSINGLS